MELMLALGRSGPCLGAGVGFECLWVREAACGVLEAVSWALCMVCSGPPLALLVQLCLRGGFLHLFILRGEHLNASSRAGAQEGE